MIDNAEKKGNKNMNILSILASDNYIVINRDLLKKYGINVTLMLCELASEYNYFDKNGKLEDGMFYSTIDNISERTGLSKYQQAEALKVLDEVGIVKSVIKGMPAKRYFNIDVEELTKQIANISLSSCKEIGKQAGEKLETKNNNIKLINKSNNLTDKESKKEESNNTQNEQVENATCGSEETNALKEKIKCLKKEIEMLKNNNIGGNNNTPEAEKPERTEKKERFKAPSVEEVQAYCTERGNNIDAQHFVDYYSARGWMLGKNHIKDWKACVRTWERNDSFKPQKQQEQPEKKYDQNGYESEEELMKMFYGK